MEAISTEVVRKSSAQQTYFLKEEIPWIKKKDWCSGTSCRLKSKTKKKCQLVFQFIYVLFFSAHNC